MSESPTPPIVENAAQPRSQALSAAAIEAVLAEFRGWLSAVGQTGFAEVSPPLETLDLHTLLAQFTALRHEVNLQTKATRVQQEQNSETLRQLTQALEALEQAHGAAEQTQERNAEERLRPVLKALVELHDAVALAGREMTRVQDMVLPLLGQLVETFKVEQPPEIHIDVPQTRPATGWRRWFGPPPVPLDVDALKKSIAGQLQKNREQQVERFRQAQEGIERIRQLLASLATGYTMSLQRVERTLRQHGLEAIPAAGQPFDPETMEVVEAVVGSPRPGGEVLEEVRRGYLWNGRVFRFAQVRVAKA